MAKAEQFDRWLHSRDLFLRNSRTEPGQISRSTIRMIDVVREFIQESPQKSPKELLTLAGAGDLLPTMRAGIVRVSFGDLDGPRGGRDTQRSYEESLQRRLKDPMSRLLFDDEIAGLVEGMVTRGLLRPHPLAEARADQASVGSRLITRLPALTRPPIDELLAMRGDLEAPLVNYRAAVVRMAKQLAHHSYSREFLAEIEALWVSDVAPAISRFREEMADHGLAREAARDLATDIGSLVRAATGPGVYVGLESVSSLSGWAAVAAGAATGSLALGQDVAKSIQRAKAERNRIARQDLYYLYALDRRLSR